MNQIINATHRSRGSSASITPLGFASARRNGAPCSCCHSPSCRTNACSCSCSCPGTTRSNSRRHSASHAKDHWRSAALTPTSLLVRRYDRSSHHSTRNLVYSPPSSVDRRSGANASRSSWFRVTRSPSLAALSKMFAVKVQ